MLLTGFDALYLNTLYIDKNLRHHGLIQAFSRTNRVLNATKPYGHILDFRQQQDKVDAAIALFSGAQPDRAREIWLVDRAPVAIGNFKQAVDDLGEFMRSHGLEAKPDQVNKLTGDAARAQFINRFKDVQRLKTQLDQYTDLTEEQRGQIEQALPKDELHAFRGAYLETAQRLKDQMRTPGIVGEPTNPEIYQLDFEFVLFASALIDYDYIMKLIARYSGQDPTKVQISREQLIGLIQSEANLLDEREEITEYVRSLKEGEGLDEAAIRTDYEKFKAERQATEIADLAQTHSLTNQSLSTFVDTILRRMIFDGEQLTDLMEPLDLGWRERRERELALMADLVPLLNKAGSRSRHFGPQCLRAGECAMTAGMPSNLVPKLRFPEFQDSGEWEPMKLGDVVTRNTETFDPQNSHDNTHLIELENIEPKTGRIICVAKLEKRNSLKSTFQAGDVLFGKLRPYLRKFARPNFQGVCTSEIWVLRSTGISSTFLFYLVQTERFIQLANISSGSRMPRAEWNFLASADFEIPHPDEQRKIADCLNLLDDLIAAGEPEARSSTGSINRG